MKHRLLWELVCQKQVYRGQRQVIKSDIYCGIWLLVPALNTYFWHTSPMFGAADAIQCYSCKATGNNELDANIRCLENAYLEECEEFYHYYNEVENGKIQDFPDYQNYYYYDDGQPVAVQPGQGVRGVPADLNVYANQPANADTPEVRQPSTRDKRPPASSSSSNKPSRSKRAPRDRASKDKEEEIEYLYEYYDAPNDTSTSGKGESRNKATDKDEVRVGHGYMIELHSILWDVIIGAGQKVCNSIHIRGKCIRLYPIEYVYGFVVRCLFSLYRWLSARLL